MKKMLLRLGWYAEAALITPSYVGCYTLLQVAGRNLGPDSTMRALLWLLLFMMCVAAQVLLPVFVNERVRLQIDHVHGREYGNRCAEWRNRVVLVTLAMAMAVVLIYISGTNLLQDLLCTRISVVCAIVKLAILLVQPELIASLRREETRQRCAFYGGRIF